MWDLRRIDNISDNKKIEGEEIDELRTSDRRIKQSHRRRLSA
jgi:hypothetical protein